MSMWPWSPPGHSERKSSGGEAVKRQRIRNEVRLPSIDLNSSIHGDVDTRNPRPQTHVVRSPKVVMNGQLWGSLAEKHAETHKSPFRLCQFCGREFGSASIQFHEKRCRQKQGGLQKQAQPLSNEPVRHIDRQASIVSNKSLDIGLIPAEYASTSDRSPRPETRTLRRSVGYSLLPSIDSTDNRIVITTCPNCGEEIPSDRFSVHKRTCRQDPPKVTTSSVMFPSLPRIFKVNKDGTSESEKEKRPSKVPLKPPTVVCYICGREYGTKSISIHEPQCFKKWKTENMKLPIDQRRPLPKKSKVATTVSRDGTERAVDRMPSVTEGKGRSCGVIEMYFAECYREFEKELLPCSKCSRTFAPERHAKHTAKCNAKPLVRSLLQ